MTRLIRYGLLGSLWLFAGTITGRTHSDDPQANVEISFYSGATVTEASKVGSSTCRLYSGAPCQGVYSLSRDGSAIRIGNSPIAYDQEEPVYELWFAFGFDDDESELIAQFHTFTIDKSGDIQAGKRIELAHPLEYDTPHTRTFDCGNGQQVTISYALHGDGLFSGDMMMSQGPHTISLRTNCMSPGGTSRNSSTLDLLSQDHAPHLFRMNFSSSSSDSPASALAYTVRVTFEPPLESLKFPFKTTVRFSRQYRLSTDELTGRLSGSVTLPRRPTGAYFTKEVELVQGKILKLVFPPDKRSQGGYEIEDTLIINP